MAGAASQFWHTLDLSTIDLKLRLRAPAFTNGAAKMYPLLDPMIGIGPVPIDADEIVRIDRNFGLGPKIFLRDNRTVITTPKALARLEAVRLSIAKL